MNEVASEAALTVSRYKIQEGAAVAIAAPPH